MTNGLDILDIINLEDDLTTTKNKLKNYKCSKIDASKKYIVYDNVDIFNLPSTMIIYFSQQAKQAVFEIDIYKATRLFNSPEPENKWAFICNIIDNTYQAIKDNPKFNLLAYSNNELHFINRNYIFSMYGDKKNKDNCSIVVRSETSFLFKRFRKKEL